MATCYRHPDRETGVSCANCGKPICPDCMTPTPVGMRCPECSKQTTKVKNVRAQYDAPPRVTIGIMAICILLWFGTASASGGEIFNQGALYGPLVETGEWWRLLTSGFLHLPDFQRGLMHIGFNMYVLWFLGNLLEPGLGPVRFTALYLASLLAGSFGALLLSPAAVTVGASGAIFGLMGAAFVMQRARGIDPMQSGIGPIILLNVAIGFVIPNVSIGGHLGGLAGGALAGFLMDRLPRGLAAPVAACVAVGAVAVAGALIIVGREFG